MKTFRFLFIALALMLCINASAHDFVVDGIYYNISSSTDLTVRVTYRGNSCVSYTNEYTGSVVIPEKVTYNSKEYSVTSIEYSAFKECSGLTSVTIPNSVTFMGNEAFYGCSGLTTVTIGNSVTDIGEWAFYSCSRLTSLTIGNSVTRIGYSAFRNCSGLTTVTIPNSVTRIRQSAFSGCSALTSVTIPNSVTRIESDAFYGTGWYKNQSDGVLYLDSWLIGCKGDKPTGTLEIKEGTKGIGDYAFSGCSGLTSVSIPNSVTSIGSSAFRDCSGLTSVTIPNSVTSIGEYTFSSCSRLTSVTIPNSVTSIGEYAFNECSGMTSLTIGNSVTNIGEYAFNECSGLTSMTIGNSVTNIGKYAFNECSGLTSLTIPNSVTSIGYSAFYGCSGLTSLTIGNSVTSIGWFAFEGCSGLTAVHITDLSAWCKIIFNDSNPTSYAHHLYLNGEEITNLVIPDDVTSLGDAFSGCYSITSVTIPNSVTGIYGTFKGCSGLTSVTIPNSLTSIGDETFYGCSGLTSVTIPNSVTSIGGKAFNGCSGIKSIHISDLSAWYKIKFGDEYANPMYSSSNEVTYVNDMELTDLTIPDSITSIPEYAFRGCTSLRRLTIPESCKTVPQYAFRGCNYLQELTLPSTCIACYDYSFYGCYSLKKINCQAETPPAVYANTFSSSIYTKATLNVPEGCADKYKAANIWKEFTNMTVGGVVPDEPKQCAAPVITYADGKLQFACETEGAEYRYTLTDSDIKSVYTDVTKSAVNLSACYTIKAYAYADGYTNSEQVTATLYWINGSDVSTNINQTEMRGVMATCFGGIITVSGLSDGETVQFYNANGALLYTGSAQNGIISYAPSTSGVIIVKIGTTSIKVVS